MSNVSFPKISDFFNLSNNTNMFRMFTDAWTTVFGIWFFAMVIGVIGGALYVKTESTIGTVVFYIVSTLLLGSILEPSFVYFAGIICMLSIGFVLYMLFVRTE